MESAVDMLLSMNAQRDGMGGGGGDGGGGGIDSAVSATDAQLLADEALARSLQQQESEHWWPEDAIARRQLSFTGDGHAIYPGTGYAGAYPGTTHPVGSDQMMAAHPVARPSRGVAHAYAESEPSLSTELGNLGSTMYSAGASTVSGAASMISSAWEWATAPAENSTSPAPRELRPIELRPVRHPAADEGRPPSGSRPPFASDELDTASQVSSAVGRSASGAEVRRRAPRQGQAD